MQASPARWNGTKLSRESSMVGSSESSDRRDGHQPNNAMFRNRGKSTASNFTLHEGASEKDVHLGRIQRTSSGNKAFGLVDPQTA